MVENADSLGLFAGSIRKEWITEIHQPQSKKASLYKQIYSQRPIPPSPRENLHEAAALARSIIVRSLTSFRRWYFATARLHWL